MLTVRLLGICGSPRKTGNSRYLLERALEGASKTAPELVEPDLYLLAGKQIAPCMDCYRCRELGACATEDDFQELRDKWVAADGIIYSVPVYHIMLAHRFSVITVLDTLIPAFDHHALKAGLTSRMASVRTVGIPVLALDDHSRLLEALVDQSIRVVTDDGAHLLILGCTGMAGMVSGLVAGLEQHGIIDVPVIDPTALAVKMAEALVDLPLSHSKRTYPTPPEKEILVY